MEFWLLEKDLLLKKSPFCLRIGKLYQQFSALVETNHNNNNTKKEDDDDECNLLWESAVSLARRSLETLNNNGSLADNRQIFLYCHLLVVEMALFNVSRYADEGGLEAADKILIILGKSVKKEIYEWILKAVKTFLCNNLEEIDCIVKEEVEVLVLPENDSIPVILDSYAMKWRAFSLWQDWNYLDKKIGRRWVPVEIGLKYTDPDWRQEIMRFSDFLQGILMETPLSCRYYLAQYNIFDQIPDLLGDISRPSFQSKSEQGYFRKEMNVITNVWIGGAGTISPLHTDPYDNLFVQVVGSKRFILIPPAATDGNDEHFFYPYPKASKLGNTSQVSHE